MYGFRGTLCFYSVDCTKEPFLEMIGGAQIGRKLPVSTKVKLAILKTAWIGFVVSAMVRSLCCGIWKGDERSELIAHLKMTSHLNIQKPDFHPRGKWLTFGLQGCYFILRFKHFLLNMENLLPPQLYHGYFTILSASFEVFLI